MTEIHYIDNSINEEFKIFYIKNKINIDSEIQDSIDNHTKIYQGTKIIIPSKVYNDGIIKSLTIKFEKILGDNYYISLKLKD